MSTKPLSPPVITSSWQNSGHTAIESLLLYEFVYSSVKATQVGSHHYLLWEQVLELSTVWKYLLSSALNFPIFTFIGWTSIIREQEKPSLRAYKPNVHMESVLSC